MITMMGRTYQSNCTTINSNTGTSEFGYDMTILCYIGGCGGRIPQFISYVLIVFLIVCTPLSIDCSQQEQYRRCREINTGSFYGSGSWSDSTRTTTGTSRQQQQQHHSSTTNITTPISPSFRILSTLQGFYDSSCELCTIDSFSLSAKNIGSSGSKPKSSSSSSSASATGAGGGRTSYYDMFVDEDYGERHRFNLFNHTSRVIILATSTPTDSFEESLIIAAGLLTDGTTRVTIITGPQMPDITVIRTALFQHIPCSQHLVASTLLDFQQLNLDTKHLPCQHTTIPSFLKDIMKKQQQQQSQNQHQHQHQHHNQHLFIDKSPGDVLLCNIQNAEVVLSATNDVLNRLKASPSLILMDATCIAGLLLAELLHVPAVLLIDEPDTFLGHILGSPKSNNNVQQQQQQQQQHNNNMYGLLQQRTDYYSLETLIKKTIYTIHRIQSIPTNVYRSITITIQDLLNSFDLTNSFIAFNRVRSRLKLKRIRLVSDMFQVGGTVLLTISHTTTYGKKVSTTTYSGSTSTNQYYDDYYYFDDSSSRSSRSSRRSYLDRQKQCRQQLLQYPNGWQHLLPNIYTIPDPLLPPCVKCNQSPTKRSMQAKMNHNNNNQDGKMKSSSSNNNNNNANANAKRRITSTTKVNTEKDPKSSNERNRNNIPNIVLSIAFASDELGRSGSRQVMLAFWLVRQSIRQLSLLPKCTSTTNSTNTTLTSSSTILTTRPDFFHSKKSKTLCWDGPSDFRLIRPGIMPEVIPPGNTDPFRDNLSDDDYNNSNEYFDDYIADGTNTNDFVTEEMTTYLDTLSRNKPIAIVSACDDSNSWTRSLGPPVVCIDAAWSARHIATDILRIVSTIYSPTTREVRVDNSINNNNKSNDESSNVFDEDNESDILDLDGLEWILSLFYRLMHLRKVKKDEWESGRQMNQDILDTLEKSGLLWHANRHRRTEEDNTVVSNTNTNSKKRTLFGSLTIYMASFILITSIVLPPLARRSPSFVQVQKCYCNSNNLPVQKQPPQQQHGKFVNGIVMDRHNNSTTNFPTSQSKKVGITVKNTSNGTKSNGQAVEQQYSESDDFSKESLLHDRSIGNIVLSMLYQLLYDFDIAWYMWTNWVIATMDGWTNSNDNDNNSKNKGNGKTISPTTKKLIDSSTSYMTTGGHIIPNGIKTSASNTHNVNGSVLLSHSISEDNNVNVGGLNGTSSNNGVRKRRTVKKRH